MKGLPKVVLHEGDLRLPLLGLSSQSAQDIFSGASYIIHNGAEVSHMQYYQSLKLPNLQSTQQLVELSLPHRIPIHYVSTSTVGCFWAASTGQDTFPEMSVAACPPPSDGSGGYESSKWASECFLENLSKQAPDGKGWPITIHRPSLISREPESPALDIMHNIRYYSEMLGAVPSSLALRGSIDVVNMSEVVSGIIRAIHDVDVDVNSKLPSLRFRHYFGKEVFSFDKFTSSATHKPDNCVEQKTKELELEEWVNAASGLGMDKTLVTLLQSLGRSRKLVLPRLVKNVT
jgi:hybrid polyketide synthase / nonribosomal peptide synthetase ACE1